MSPDPMVDTAALLPDPQSNPPPTSPPSGVTPTVVADAKSDAAGKPRSKAESPPPPGTDKPTFWQAGATKAALWSTLEFLLFWVFVYVDYLYTGAAPSPDAIKLTIGTLASAWGIALGIHKTDANALWWK